MNAPMMPNPNIGDPLIHQEFMSVYMQIAALRTQVATLVAAATTAGSLNADQVTAMPVHGSAAHI